MKDSSPLSTRKNCDKMHFQAILSESSDGFSDQSPTLAGGPPVQPLLEESKSQTEMQFENEEDIEALGAAAPPLPTAEAPKPLPASAASTVGKMDSPARKKGAGAGRGNRTMTSVMFSLCPLADLLISWIESQRNRRERGLGARVADPSFHSSACWGPEGSSPFLRAPGLHGGSWLLS